jgi:hypothetical protein
LINNILNLVKFDKIKRKLKALSIGNYGSIKVLLMKQSFTLENDLAMIIDLLTEMVENKNLSQLQMEQIMENIFNRCSSDIPQEKPSESVVNTIMNYSKALKVLKSNPNQSFSMIIN